VVKVLHGRALRPGHADRFRREIEILQKLEHARIVPILAAGEADGVCFFTMPFVDGETLRARLHADGPLSARDTLLIARDIADALGHAHGRGVVHRDVKPENVLISADGAQLMDFGFASAPSLMSHDALDGEAALVIGTPHYISPEQVRGRQASDWRGDFFSLGCVMHEMLTGRPPWVAASARELMRLRLADAAPDVRRLRADVPPTWRPSFGVTWRRTPTTGTPPPPSSAWPSTRRSREWTRRSSRAQPAGRVGRSS
jgi:serine/threonine-protein kinase